ncbi:hypothetical protein SCLCIDRAFT_29860 [Scleroderma citrinum Foug A]|uniref:Uncharacterized protein n=1 Tax=Scleroderma citrinum Foug A TaxID=1036808 RepID=A0A0C2ZUG8_9AGAM|nr:hypothetical protein SCLCIDRAFT_29860 [Scleroderma citrinum Foug A]
MCLGDWYWNQGAQKSWDSFKELLDIVGDSAFSLSDISKTQWGIINEDLGQNHFNGNLPQWLGEEDGWKCSPVTISVPFHGHARNPGCKNYTIQGFYHHSLVSIIREKISNPTHAALFHYEPYKLRWHPPHRNDDVKVYGELFNSAAFLEAHQQLQDSPPEPGCDLPCIVVALMFWSHLTQLTQFGNAKLWPLYVFFGNESKYWRCQLANNMCSHAAYFQVLLDEFKDFLAANFGDKFPNDVLFTHCHRELFHGQWQILFDEEFLEAYRHGIVIKCCDGIKRHFYLRIFTYSADYPEKYRSASNLRPKVLHAWELIYERNYVVNTPKIEELLRDQSLVPTTNAFSDKLSAFGFNLFAMLVVDLLHEFELSVWKAIFMHLLHILDSFKHGKLHEINRRYRQVPSFGRDTIRRFSRNSLEMKRMAAHNFEDLLQASKAATVPTEVVPNIPDEHYNIKKSQHLPIDLNRFVQKNMDDPAITDFIPKLKCHLLPRILAIHGCTPESSSTSQPMTDQVLFKDSHIFQHKVLHVNYTTYDVHHNQDIFNPGSDHCDLIMLATPGSDEEPETQHHFCYARLISVYHANIHFIGPGSKDYLPRQLDFIHVWWFELVPPTSVKNRTRLDMLQFVPMNDVNTFDFVDPADILRGCHLIPAFARGRSHPDHINFSPITKDSNDWKYYYMNWYKYFQPFDMTHLLMIAQRFVDRDMLLRYHWGLGVGHTYSHVRDQSEHSDESITPQALHDGALDHVSLNDQARMESVNPDDEFLLIDRDGLGWESEDMGGDGSDDGSEADSVIYKMYGSNWGDEGNLD